MKRNFSTKNIRNLYRLSNKPLLSETKNADYKSALPANNPLLNHINNSEIELEILQSGKDFWLREYWDRFIRNENHYYSAIEYIHQNPVKANLVDNNKDWRFSSASHWPPY